MDNFWIVVWELRSVIAFVALMLTLYIALCAQAAHRDKVAAMRQHPAGGRFDVIEASDREVRP